MSWEWQWYVGQDKFYVCVTTRICVESALYKCVLIYSSRKVWEHRVLIYWQFSEVERFEQNGDKVTNHPMRPRIAWLSCHEHIFDWWCDLEIPLRQKHKFTEELQHAPTHIDATVRETGRFCGGFPQTLCYQLWSLCGTGQRTTRKDFTEVELPLPYHNRIVSYMQLIPPILHRSNICGKFCGEIWCRTTVSQHISNNCSVLPRRMSSHPQDTLHTLGHSTWHHCSERWQQWGDHKHYLHR